MEEPRGLFSMDIHRLFRTFIPGLITVFTFLLFFYCTAEGGPFKRVSDLLNEYEKISTSLIFMFLIISYVLGVPLEWISDGLWHGFCLKWNYKIHKEARRRVKELCHIFHEKYRCKRNKTRLEYATLLDYCLHSINNNDDLQRVQKNRIYYMFSVIHSTQAIAVGIFLVFIFGIFCHVLILGLCINKILYFIIGIISLILLFIFLYSYYRLHLHGLIAYKKVFIRNNVPELMRLWRCLQYRP